MTVRDFVRALRRRWLLLLICAAVGAAGGGGYGLFQTPQHVANSQLLLSVSASDSTSSLREDTLYLQERMQSYAAVLASPALGERVAAALDSDLTGAEIAEMISVSVPDSTSLLDISVSDPSAETARQIAAAIGDEFPRLLAQLESGTQADGPNVQVATLRPPVLPTAPATVGLAVAALIGLVLGLAGGLALALLRDALDDRVRDEEDGRFAELPAVEVLSLHRPARRAVAGTASGADGDALRRAALRLCPPAPDGRMNGRILTVTAPVSGEDAASVGDDLATAYAIAGQRVVLVDAHLREDPSTVRWESGGRARPGLAEVLRGEADPTAVAEQRADGVRVLTAGRAAAGAQLPTRRTAEVLQEVLAEADVVVVVAPAVQDSADAEVCAALSDRTLLVVRQQRTHRREARRAAQTITALSADVALAVLAGRPREA